MVRRKATKVALVIPAYNESLAVGDVIEKLRAVFSKSSYNYEIIVVDDGSSDNTATVARLKNATVIRHILNSGAGGATATGLSYAQQQGFDIATTCDADGQHAAEDVLKGVKLLDSSESGIDLLIGSRLIDASGMSKVKILGNKGLSLLTRVLFGINVTDSQSGLRIFSRRALQNLRWRTSGYEFCSEMLWRAHQQQMIISEYPIKAIYTDYSMAKGQNNWNAFNIVRSLLRRRFVELFSE